MAGECWCYLSFILCSQLSFEGGEQGGKDDSEVTRQSVSGHGGQEGEHTGVHRRSSQLVKLERTFVLVSLIQY